MKNLLAITLLGLAFSAQADVSCKFGSTGIVVSDSLADFHHSPSGKQIAPGAASLFRLLTLDESDGGPNSVELKTTNVTKPGDYALSMEPGWRSIVDVRGEHQRVTGGKFHFTRFDVNGSQARAAGTVEFTTGQITGGCSFDVEVQATNRDGLGR